MTFNNLLLVVVWSGIACYTIASYRMSGSPHVTLYDRPRLV
jgi:hypothetical protein